MLRITSNGGNVLLTGDIEAGSQAEMLGRGAALAADALVVPHHGSHTSSTPAFIAAVAPHLALIAAGYRNRFGHPRKEFLARYAHAGAARADRHHSRDRHREVERVARDRHDVGDLDDALRRRRCIVVEARVGERFYVFVGETGVRLMCAWDTTPESVDRFLDDLRRVINH